MKITSLRIVLAVTTTGTEVKKKTLNKNLSRCKSHFRLFGFDGSVIELLGKYTVDLLMALYESKANLPPLH